MGNGMSTSKTNFMKECESYYSNYLKAYCIDLWEKGENNNMIYNGSETPPGTMPSGEYMGMPVFQKELQDTTTSERMKIKSIEDGGTLIMETEGPYACRVFMPGGSKENTPNKMNYYKESVCNPIGDSPQNCATSWGHILVMPTNIRKYNSVTLEEKDIELLNEMKRVGKFAFDKLLNGSDTMVGSLRWAMKQDDTITLSNGNAVNTKLTVEDFDENSQDTFLKCQSEGIDSVKESISSNMKHYLHVGQSASIGYLHIHTISVNMCLTSKTKMEEMAGEAGYEKMTEVDEVIKFIKSSEYKSLREKALSQSESELSIVDKMSKVTTTGGVDSGDSSDDECSLTRQSSVMR
jgi:hypothetical protein